MKMKLSGDNQDQNVSNGTAIQSAGDVNIGLRLGEVREICFLYLDNNFPKLREEALNESKKHVQELSDALMDKLSRKLDENLDERLKDPDVQESINDSVMHTARKTKNANINMLSEMVLAKIKSEDDDENSLIISEAIKSAEKLNLNHIKAISIIYLMRFTSLKRPNNQGIYYEIAYRNSHIDNIDGNHCIKEIDLDYLCYAGVIHEGKYYTKSTLDIISSKTKFMFKEATLKENLGQDNDFSKNFSELSNMMLSLGFSTLKDFDKAVLTFLGKAIATCFLNSKGYNLNTIYN